MLTSVPINALMLLSCDKKDIWAVKIQASEPTVAASLLLEDMTYPVCKKVHVVGAHAVLTLQRSKNKTK